MNDPTTNKTARTKKQHLVRLMAMAWVIALVAAACGGSDDGSSDATTSAPAERDQTAGGRAGTAAPATTLAPSRAEAALADSIGSGGVGQTPIPTNLNRDIIFTADLQIAVTDVAAAGVEAAQRIEALGGFLFGQQTVGGTEPRSILVFKIIPEQFQTALEQLGSIGEIRNQTVSADDVTQRVVNLESQIATNQASVERLRELLDGVGSVEELAQLEAQLLARETNLETLRGSLRTLQDQVSLATITVRIEEARLRPALEIFATAYPGFEDSGTSCPGADVDLTVDRDTFATVCFEIRNVGDTGLTGFQLTDTVLDITIEDVLVVDGDPTKTLEPGETMLLAYGPEVDRRLRTQTRVSADPVNADGVVLQDRTVAGTTSVVLRAEDPGGIPSFGDGVSRSWRALLGLGKVGLLALGLALPFIWVPFVLFFAASWLRRRQQARYEAAAAEHARRVAEQESARMAQAAVAAAAAEEAALTDEDEDDDVLDDPAGHDLTEELPDNPDDES